MDYLVGILILVLFVCGCAMAECECCACNCSNDIHEINNDIQISDVKTPVHKDHIEI